MRFMSWTAAGAVILSACAAQGTNSGPIAIATSARPANPLINGKLIFTTGKDINGVAIGASPAPLRRSCEACHNAGGTGGLHLPGGGISADLRQKAMQSDPKHPYTLSTIERAISMGIDNAGRKLDPVMPRWKMSKRDLHDVGAYVLTLK